MVLVFLRAKLVTLDGMPLRANTEAAKVINVTIPINDFSLRQYQYMTRTSLYY
jgi:hypothetical protein